MDEELKSAIEESLPSDQPQVESAPQDETPESSPEVPAETPAKQVEQEVPFHQHPRFKELVEDRNTAREDAKRANAQLMEIVNKLQQPQAPKADEYANLTPEERVFYESLDKRIQSKVQDLVGKKEAEFKHEILQTKATQAAMMYDRFLKDHPDVKSKSPEEDAIAEKFRQGYSLDDSYKLVMGPSREQQLMMELDKLKRERQQQTVKKKVAASQDTGSVSQSSPVISQKLSTRQKIEGFVEEFLRTAK